MRSRAQERLRTVYNGVDPAHFPPAGPEPAQPTISWAGRVDPIKDLETLIRAFALVRAEIPNAGCGMFGGTPAGNEAYRAAVRGARRLSSGWRRSAIFEGRVEDIQDAYAAGHVVVALEHLRGLPVHADRGDDGGPVHRLHRRGRRHRGGRRHRPGGAARATRRRWRPPAWSSCATTRGAARLGTAARRRALEFFTVEQAVDDLPWHLRRPRRPPAGCPGRPGSTARRSRARDWLRGAAGCASGVHCTHGVERVR